MNKTVVGSSEEMEDMQIAMDNTCIRHNCLFLVPHNTAQFNNFAQKLSLRLQLHGNSCNSISCVGIILHFKLYILTWYQTNRLLPIYYGVSML